jgi:hypothetical protein
MQNRARSMPSSRRHAASKLRAARHGASPACECVATGDRRLHGDIGNAYVFPGAFKWVDGSSPGDGTPSNLTELSQPGYSHCECRKRHLSGGQSSALIDGPAVNPRAANHLPFKSVVHGTGHHNCKTDAIGAGNASFYEPNSCCNCVKASIASYLFSYYW